VVALCADLIGSLKFDDFKKITQSAFFQIGIAEANMIGIAAGLTIGGKIHLQELRNSLKGRV
jgi:transketolase